MKLNPECIRDLMLILEDITGISKVNPYRFREINCESLMWRNDLSNKYTENEVAYTLIQLAESGYIYMPFRIEYETVLNLGNILYVTPKGHEFIAKITDEQRWQTKIIPLLNTMGNISLSVIEAVSSGVTNAFITQKLNGGL